MLARYAVASMLILVAGIATAEPRHGPTGDHGQPPIRILAWGDALAPPPEVVLTWTSGVLPAGSTSDILLGLIRRLIERDPEGAAVVLRAEGITYHYADGRRQIGRE